MKCIYFLFLLYLLAQCKVKKPADTSNTPLSALTTEQDTAATSAGNKSDVDVLPGQVNPDECLLEAEVIRCETSNKNHMCLLQIVKIFEKGFGFSQNLKKSDQIQAQANQKLNDSTTVIIAIEYVHSLKTGHYRVNKILEN